MSAGMFGVIQVWANNPRGSFVCISSHSGRCSLVVLYGFQTVPHVMYLLHSIQTRTLWFSNRSQRPGTRGGSWVSGLCMSSYFQCCVNGQGGLLCFPFLNYCYHSFKFWAPFFFFFCPTQSLQYNMQRILCCGGGQWPEHSHSQLVKERSLVHLGLRWCDTASPGCQQCVIMLAGTQAKARTWKNDLKGIA